MTPAQELHWATTQRTLLTSNGEPNPTMIAAYANAHARYLNPEVEKWGFHDYVKIASFLKTYPDMLPVVLPPLYKKASQEKDVIDLMNTFQQHYPDLLLKQLLHMFSKKKAFLRK